MSVNQPRIVYFAKKDGRVSEGIYKIEVEGFNNIKLNNRRFALLPVV